MRTNPFTGKRYAKRYWTAQRVETALLACGVESCCENEIAAWDDQQRHDVGDWAMRSYLRASDNFNRVPPKPEWFKHEVAQCA